MSQIGRALRVAKGIARSPAQVDKTFGVAASTNDAVQVLVQRLDALDAKLATVGPEWADLANTLKAQTANLEALQTAQLEALTYLNRTLRELSERVGALEKAAAGNAG